MISLVLTGCGSSAIDLYDDPQFDWMPNPLQWERNWRDCRSQPQCNPADLFNRTGYISTIG